MIRGECSWRDVRGDRVGRTGEGRHMTVLSKRTTTILVMTLVASLLVPAPGALMAEDGRPDNLPGYTACVGPANASAGFVDTVGLNAEAAINCLAYYGITLGTTPTHFSPSEPISRWQMALFLTRAAGPAGIALPEPADQGFLDLDTKQSIQDAINQIAAIGITKGTSATTFHPHAPMDRRQMALFLYRFLLLSTRGPGGADAAQVTPDDTVFEDLAGQPAPVVSAIGAMYEMGVTLGKTATTYAPNALVTRAQMALFMTRALAHTNTRPVGVSMQSPGPDLVSSGDTLEIQVSVRDTRFRPRVRSRLDVFSTPAKDPYASFGSDGGCLDSVEIVLGSQVCIIDNADQRLDESGNLTIVLEPTDDMLLWAWTGSTDDEFRVNTSVSGSFKVEVVKPATAVRVRDDLKSTASIVRLGDAVEMTFQLVDDDGRPVAESGVRIQLVTTYEENGVTGRTNIKTYLTNQDGRVVVAFPAVDPDRASDDDSVKLDVDVVVEALEVVDRSTLLVVEQDADENEDILITWSEEAPVASTLRLRQTNVYNELPSSGPAAVNVVRAALTDQYGDPVDNAVIEFSSDQASGLSPTGAARSTGTNGVATLRYLWNGSEPASELISAEVAAGGVVAEPLHHYWAVPQRSGRSALGVPILVGDVTRNVIVHDLATPQALRYDAHDRFTIRDAVVSMAVFEAALASGDYSRVSYNDYSKNSEDVSSFDLTNTRAFDEA